ncbi:hypothetical protein D3C85_1857480 [compost metagenome]
MDIVLWHADAAGHQGLEAWRQGRAVFRMRHGQAVRRGHVPDAILQEVVTLVVVVDVLEAVLELAAVENRGL